MKELYACGFNAHGQLKHASEEDVHTFERIASDEDDIEVLQASWSRTVGELVVEVFPANLRPCVLHIDP